MIKNLHIGNFKAFGKTQKIPIKPITLIFGPNSAGKSSVLHSLLFAKHVQVTNEVDVHKTETGEIDLGGIPYYMHKHNQKNIITFGFDLSLNDFLRKQHQDSDFQRLTIILQFKEKKGLLVLVKCNISDGIKQLAEFYNRQRSDCYDLECNYVDKDFLLKGIKCIGNLPGYKKDISKKILHKKQDFINNLEILKNITITGYLIPSLVSKSYNFCNEMGMPNHKLLSFNEHLEDYLRSIFEFLFISFSRSLNIDLSTILYLGPLRCYPDRHIFSSTAHNLKRFSTGEIAWKILLSSDNDEILKNLNDWMRRLFNNIYEFKVQNFHEVDKDGVKLNKDNVLNRLCIFDNKWNIELTHHDVGFGLSQILPVLVNSLGYDNKIILIEQPELHLHPALQADLGDMFIESAIGKNKNTFLLETHSEHLILRIMRRIRECYHDEKKYKKEAKLPPITPDDVAVLYVERQGEESVVKEMRLDEEGYLIDEWPGGFFADRLGELI